MYPTTHSVFRLARWAALPVLGLTLGISCGPPPATPVDLPGLSAEVRVYTDPQGTAHVVAATELDLYRAWGYVQARDRFFQMDLLRRTAQGRRAELVGFAGLQVDAFLRPTGLDRAAVRNLEIMPLSVRARFEVFAEGVNAWLDANPLPPEYTTLEITHVPRWSAHDSMTVAQIPFDDARFAEVLRSDVVPAYDALLGPVVGHALIDEILQTAPMAAVPAAPGEPPPVHARHPGPEVRSPGRSSTPSELQLAASSAGGIRPRPTGQRGSNAWVIAGQHTETGQPIVAADPHQQGSVPNTFYEVHLIVSGDADPALDVAGNALVGVPLLAQWHNGQVAIANTLAQTDGVDYFDDRLVRGDPGCPTRLCIDSDGTFHEVVEHAETYAINNINGVPDDLLDLTFLVEASAPAAVRVLEVPFRSFGAVFRIEDPSVLGAGSPAETRVITMQSTALEPTKAAQAYLGALRARNVFEAEESLMKVSAAPINWIAADADGNTAWFTTGEVPLRSDLEQGFVNGEPPWRVRDGSGAGNWLPDAARSQGQAIPYRVVPRSEMPRSYNPGSGYLLSANHDGFGLTWDGDPLNERRPSSATGLYYLGNRHAPGLRAARIAQLLRDGTAGGNRLSIGDVVAMQGNTQAMDAELLRPFLEAALARGLEPGAPPELVPYATDPEVQDAIARISAWDLSRPTGIPEGWDYGRPAPPDPVVPAAEAEASVAATLYSVWRGTVNQATTLRTIFQELGLPYPGVAGDFGLIHTHDLFGKPGLRPSGLDFFDGPQGLSPEDERDFVILRSMREALDALSGPAFASVFGGSVDPDVYRWGRLHRLSIPHPLGGLLTVPPAAGFAGVGPGSPGIPRDGGFLTVNLGHDGDAHVDETGFRLQFLISTNRLVMSFDQEGAPVVWNQMVGSSPGGTDDPRYRAALEDWLRGEPHRLEMRIDHVQAKATRREVFASP